MQKCTCVGNCSVHGSNMKNVNTHMNVFIYYVFICLSSYSQKCIERIINRGALLPRVKTRVIVC